MTVGREWVVVLIFGLIVVLGAMTGRRSGHRGRSTAGHYDPDAIFPISSGPPRCRRRRSQAVDTTEEG